MAFPIHQQVEEAGIEIKTLAGQWAHDYPDRIEGHSSQGSGRGVEAYPYTLDGTGLTRCCTGLIGI